MNTTTDNSPEAPAALGSISRDTPPTTTSGLPQPKSRSAARRGTNGQTENPLPAEQVLAALKALKRGDFDVRLAGAWTGVAGQVADTYNEIAEMMARSTEELT